MPIYELINPSDPYTFKAPDIKVAGMAALLLSSGKFGARQIEPEQDEPESSPALFGWKPWLQEQGITPEWTGANKEIIADALGSFLIGDLHDRHEVHETLALLPPGKREGWLANRHDRRRSSMNNIGAAAHKLARQMRDAAKKLEAEPAKTKPRSDEGVADGS